MACYPKLVGFCKVQNRKKLGDTIKNVIITMDIAYDEQYQFGKTWSAEAGCKGTIALLPSCLNIRLYHFFLYVLV